MSVLRQGTPVRVAPDLAPRRYRPGMWAFVLHRVSGVAILLFLLLHLWKVGAVSRSGPAAFDQAMASMATRPFIIAEWLLFLAILFHGINGVRLLLFDAGVGVRRQQSLFWGVLGLSAVLVAAGTWSFLRRFLIYPW